MIKLPTLDEAGYTTDRGVILNKIFGYYLVSDYTQSNTFRGDIHSLRYTLSKNAPISDTEDEITKSLYRLLEDYYDTLDISVEGKEITTDDGIIDVYGIFIKGDYDGVTYNYSNSIEHSNSDIEVLNKSINKLYNIGV